MSARGWIRCHEKRGPECPVCSHKGGCMISADGTVALCLRVQEGCMTRRDGSVVAARNGMGYMHRIGDKGKGRIRPMRALPPPAKRTPREWEKLHADCLAAMTPERLAEISAYLGVSTTALVEYECGWHVATEAATFPMRDGDGKIIGIRTRHRDGQKRAIQGSANGLFIRKDFVENWTAPTPFAWTRDDFPMVFVLPEGPTDCCAAHDLGILAVGRPSCSSGGEYMRRLLQRTGKCEVIVLADRDTAKVVEHRGTRLCLIPGLEGALRLAQEIMPECGALRMAFPPPPAKDLRAWLRNGGTRDSFLAWLLNPSSCVAVTGEAWFRRAWARVDQLKREALERYSPSAVGLTSAAADNDGAVKCRGHTDPSPDGRMNGSAEPARNLGGETAKSEALVTAEPLLASASRDADCGMANSPSPRPCERGMLNTTPGHEAEARLN